MAAGSTWEWNPMARCFVCDYLLPDPIVGAWTICPLCNVGFEYGPDRLATCRDELAAMMALDTVDLPRSQLAGPSGWRIGLFGLRIAATRFDRVLTPLGMRGWLVQRVPSKLYNIVFPDYALKLEPMESAPGAARQIAFGCIARPEDIDRLAWFLTNYGAIFSQFVFVLDGPEGDAHAARERLAADVPAGADLIVHARPLDGDYGRQRNLVQSLAQRPWILQLDTDERIDPALARHIGAVIEDADYWRSKVVGFPRRNLVDEALSNFYPDVQYRLNRSDVRFENRVHEIPIERRDWRKVSISLAGHIEHRLSRDRVIERSRRYEAMVAGAGRPHDEAQLLLPYAGFP